jgi:hypothetical protein
MSEYRNRTTGEVKTQGEWRKLSPNISLPRVWNQNVFDVLNIDPVLAGAKPTEVGTYQTIVRDGVEQDANGNWVEKYVVRDMFSTSPELGTKAEQEAAYQVELDNNAAQTNRDLRNRLLADTDWTGLSDVTMSAEMTTYRQALRDITTHANWPNLEPNDWPTQP